MQKPLPIVPIAVIGMACWYPGANNLLQLWENILGRRRQFRLIPDQRLPLSDYYHPDPNEPDKTYARRAALIDGFTFEWASRRIPKSTFESTDITHWLALEVALSAVKDAGYSYIDLPKEHTGVILGNSLTGEQTRSNIMRMRWPYVRRALREAAKSSSLSDTRTLEIETALEKYYKSPFPPANEDTLAGVLSNTIAGRICNYMDLCGGGYTVDGACASSLLAVATGATGLVNHDLNLALTGGVDISLDTLEMIGFAKTGALTRKDMTVYDRRGSGFIPGEGCGFALLKRLEDAKKNGDYVYAVLNGWGISSDGGKTGVTAPSAEGQTRALKRAYQRAPYPISSLDFIEGHGTGTSVGDHAELRAINLAMAEDPDASLRSCGLTSLKSIIGHTKAASGIGGFIKAVMAVNRRIIPPTAGCEEPHPLFDKEALTIFPINQGACHKPTKTLRAGISAMGFGGINCHVTVTSEDSPNPRLNPSLTERELMASAQATEMFVLSADSISKLRKKIRNLIEISAGISEAELTDLAAKLSLEADDNAGMRCAVITGDTDELITQFEYLHEWVKIKFPSAGNIYHDPTRLLWMGNHAGRNRIGMLFPGQGSQHLNMARILVERFEWARNLVRQADRCLSESGLPPVGKSVFRTLDYARNPDEVNRWFQELSATETAQPAICLGSVIWYEFLKKMGIHPTAVGGHSLGELTGFYVAGAYGISELIHFAGVRGRAMTASEDTPGAMISLQCTHEDANRIIDQVSGYVVLANINAPRQMVLSGEKPAVDQAVRTANKRGIHVSRLKVSNAFHSKLAEKAAEVIRSEAHLPKTMKSPEIRLFSSKTGHEITSGLDVGKHFSEQVLAQVVFTDMIVSMSEVCDIFLEVGPGRALSGLVNNIMGKTGPICLPVESSASNDKDLNMLLGALFVHGVDIQWHELYHGRLVRPFVPSSDRLFIENPCEKPFDVQDTDEMVISQPRMGKVEHLLGDLAHLSDEELTVYLQNRGPFLSQVIQADMKYTYPDGIRPEMHEPIDNKATELPKIDASVTTRESGISLEETLFHIIQKATGFPKETLTADMKLLDDLNLDSIKAGDVIARFSQRSGVLEQADFSMMANASLQQIIDAVSQLQIVHKAGIVEAIPREKIKGKKGIVSSDILEIVLDQTSEITGYPRETLEVDALVEQDLNIGADMLKKLIEKLSALLDIDMQLDLAPLSRRSLKQIATILERIFKSQSTERTQTPNAPFDAITEILPDSWIRNFSVELLEKAPAVKPEWWGNRQEDNWEAGNVLILYENGAENIPESLRKELFNNGARVEITTYDAAKAIKAVNDPAYSHLIAVLPDTEEQNIDSAAYLRDIIRRLAGVSSPPPASKAPRRRTTVTFVQFGGGFFGAEAEFSHITRCCTSALAKSLHLERNDLRVRVLDFSPSLAAKTIAQKTIDEIDTPEPFAAVGFDVDSTRRIQRPRLLNPVDYQPSTQTWSKNDVILITGGAKGITALCALNLARSIGVKVALVGRSPHPITKPAHPAASEITATLKKYSEEGLIANYFSCDATDRQAVFSLVDEIKDVMGPITGVVHGAGLNIPRPLGYVSIDEAFNEVAPKVLGALHLIEALEKDFLKLFIGFTSIIGITGMRGNAWYGFSNEALDIILRRLSNQRPHIRTLSIAYSIWRDEGMGARLGSVEALKKQGINAIPTKAGVDHFVRLFLNDPGVHQVILTARFGNPDTWSFIEPPMPEKARYLETPVQITPGVESIFQARLTLERDPYLHDHVFNGSYLFPAVFGLEAMAQAVAHVSGIHAFGRVRLEDITLDRPITIDPQEGTDLIIHAVLEEQSNTNIQMVRAGIFKSELGIKSDFFSAVFILGLPPESLKHTILFPEKPTNISPVPDLYRDTLLFQGPRFQRISKIWSITGNGLNKPKAIFTTNLQELKEATITAFPDPRDQSLYLGDPFFRDSLLQSAALLVPQDTSLPIFIQRLDIYPYFENTPTPINALIQLNQKENQVIKNTVTVIDSRGIVIEKFDKYKLKILKHNEKYPEISDLVSPEARDNAILMNTFDMLSDRLQVKFPKVILKYHSGVYNTDKESRRKFEFSILEEMVGKYIEIGTNVASKYEIRWLDSGSPFIMGIREGKIDTSIAYDDRLNICVSGNSPQACHVVPISHRTKKEWGALIDKTNQTLRNTLIEDTKSELSTNTGLLAAQVLSEKTFGDSSLELFYKDDDITLFKPKTKETSIFIITISLDFTWGPERILALVVSKPTLTENKAIKADIGGYKDILEANYLEFLPESGPQGQSVLIRRIPITFKPTAQLSRTVYFSNFLFWVGEIREFSVWPVLRDIGRKLATGKWGQITNYCHLKVLGEATTQDLIEIHIWASGNGGPENSTLDLTFDFRKILPDQDYERLAWCEQQTTWVQVLGRGIVKPQRYPEPLWQFIKAMLPRYNAPNIAEPLPEPLKNLKNISNDIINYEAPFGPNIHPVLWEKVISTSLENANAVGNIYYAHYYVWQGIARDRYFFNLIPDYYQGIGERGELICLECRVDHLREAMPFDRIVVTMALKILRTFSAVFYFEYFREDPDGTRVKLAFGEHEAVWVVRDDTGKPTPAPFPGRVQTALKQAISQME